VDDIDTIVFSSQSARTLNKFRDLAGNPGLSARNWSIECAARSKREM
jgi:hypothetical protein